MMMIMKIHIHLRTAKTRYCNLHAIFIIFKKEVSIGFYCPRSFRVTAPQIWNMLPSHLKDINVSRKQFKSDHKTWIFVQATCNRRLRL